MPKSSRSDSPCLEDDELDALLRKARRQLRPGERTSLAYYVDLGHHAINAALRQSGPPAGSTLRHVTLIDSAIAAQAPLRRCAVVWRGIRTPRVANVLAESEVGDLLVQPSFTSTTVSRRLAEVFADGILLNILLPPGLRVLYVPPTGVKAEEREVLLPRGVVYEIRRITDNEVEVVAHEPVE